MEKPEYLFRGKKLYIPIVNHPWGPAEAVALIKEHEVFEQMIEWLKKGLSDSGSMLSVNDVTLMEILGSKFELLDEPKKFLFQLPTFKKG